MRHVSLGLIAATSIITGCLPDVDVDESRVSSPRILAVRSVPAEAAPGERVRLEALYASGEGRVADGLLEWSRCDARVPLAELGPVSPACLAWEDPALVSLGFGASIEATLSLDACRLFGPDPPPSMPGEPAGRVTDPDVSGGYYQPMRAVEPSQDAMTFADVRLVCGVAGATQAQAAELRRRRRLNENPSVSTVFVQRADGSDALLAEEETLEVRAGETITLEANWEACPTSDVCGDGLCGIDETVTSCADDCRTPRGCAGAERYVRFDVASRSISEARESMRVAFFATRGSFETERAGRDASDVRTYASSRWHAPSETGNAVLWVVLRDARGGVAWTERHVVVMP